MLRKMASREGITESALVKQLLGAVLRTSALDASPSSPTDGQRNRDSRLTVRLAPEDLTLLKERAGSRSMASATYAAVLLRSHLRNAVPLPKEELLALKRSIAELGAIGRNLNQIARAVNSGERVSLPGRQELLAMLKIGDALRDHVKALLKANTASWRGNAELAH